MTQYLPFLDGAVGVVVRGQLGCRVVVPRHRRKCYGVSCTLYTLVMATLMITGGKVGSMIDRRRAFAIGCAIYGCGSLTTALATSLRC